MTTKNLVVKKICWAGGVADCSDFCCDKRFGLQILEQLLKATDLFRNICLKENCITCHYFCLQNMAVRMQSFFHREIRQPNKRQKFGRLAHIEVKPVDHSLESLNSEVIYFLV